MADPVVFLTYLVIVLLAGILSSLLADFLRIPKILFLLIAGLILKTLTIDGARILTFPSDFITITATFTLAIVIFEGSSRFKFRDFNALTTKVLRLFFLTLLFSLLLVGTFSYFITGVRSIPLAILFSVLITSTAAEVVLVLIKNPSSKAAKILQIESLINNPFIVLIPFIIISFLTSKESFLFFEQTSNFLNQIITGLGTGLFVGLIVPRIYSIKFTEKFNHIASLSLIVVAIGTYVLAENLGGNGPLAVALAGVMFGNLGINLKILGFSSIFSEAFQILIFVLTGLVISLSLNTSFLFAAFTLYFLYLVARFAAAKMFFKELSFKDILFTTLVTPKGVMFAVLILALSTLDIPGLDIILDYALAIFLMSIVVSTIAVKIFHKPAPRKYIYGKNFS